MQGAHGDRAVLRLLFDLLCLEMFELRGGGGFDHQRKSAQAAPRERSRTRLALARPITRPAIHSGDTACAFRLFFTVIERLWRDTLRASRHYSQADFWLSKRRGTG